LLLLLLLVVLEWVGEDVECVDRSLMLFCCELQVGGWEEDFFIKGVLGYNFVIFGLK
jgi:hypothetical protein